MLTLLREIQRLWEEDGKKDPGVARVANDSKKIKPFWAFFVENMF